MTWAKLDDKFHSHPTTWIVGLEGNGLFCRAISYCADQLTDGFVPEAWVYAQVPSTKRERDSHGLIGKLTDAGLWERVEEGWRIPGYLEFNPSRDDEVARRAEISLRRSEAGKRGAQSRWGPRLSDGDRTLRNAARNDLNRAIARGEVTRQPCEDCGADNAQGHHEDYSKPLDVDWLCSKCHGKRHGKRGPMDEAA